MKQRGGLFLALVLACAPVHADDGQRFPQTAQRLLKAAEVAALNPADRRYAVNEIYARHGWYFKTAAIRAQFAKFTWYKPIPNREPGQVVALFNGWEKKNLQLLIQARPANQEPGPKPAKSAVWAGEKYPQTRTQVMNSDEASNFSPVQTQYAINEMYARHGYWFKNPQIRKNFARFRWYRPVKGRNMTAAQKLLTKTESANLEIFKNLADVEAC